VDLRKAAGRAELQRRFHQRATLVHAARYIGPVEIHHMIYWMSKRLREGRGSRWHDGGSWWLVCARFLERGLLEVVRDSLLAPGGAVLWATFADVTGDPPPAPPFRPSRRLRPGQAGPFIASSLHQASLGVMSSSWG
jgi:hypothetical protein